MHAYLETLYSPFSPKLKEQRLLLQIGLVFTGMVLFMVYKLVCKVAHAELSVTQLLPASHCAECCNAEASGEM